jgi:dTDP-4-dehydrorhamnose reductase
MKVLVTGARGQVGAELVLYGKKMGLNLLATGHHELDITSYVAVNTYIEHENPDIVINAAAYTAVDKAEAEPDLAFLINRDGPSHLALICSKHRIPLLHISTDYVFDGTKGSPYEENDQPNPQSIYGKSKLEGEQAVKQNLVEHLILRVAWVFGAYGHNFVRTMLRLGGERKEIRVVSDQHGSPTWAGDIARTLITILVRYRNQQDLPWGTYHYTGYPSTTWYGFSKAIFDIAVEKNLLDHVPKLEAIATEEYPTPAHRPANSILNCEKIAHVFEIKQADWSIGLKNVLNNWKRQ